MDCPIMLLTRGWERIELSAVHSDLTSLNRLDDSRTVDWIVVTVRTWTSVLTCLDVALAGASVNTRTPRRGLRDSA